MSPAFPARRRAEEFQRRVDGETGPARGDLADLATLVDELRALPAVQPRAEFSADLRDRLMSAAPDALAAGPAAAATESDSEVAEKLTVGHLTDPVTRRRHQRRVTTLVAAMIVAGGTASAGYASQAALPGDTLYPVKRAIENLDAGFASGTRDKGETLLADAGTRLGEIRDMTAGPAVDSGQVNRTLETYADQAARASDLLLSDYDATQDPASIKALRDFAATGTRTLTGFHAVLPAETHSALADAAGTLMMIDQAAETACSTCGGEGVDELPSVLLDSDSPLTAPATVPDPAPDQQPQAEARPDPQIKLPSDVPSDVPGTIDESTGSGSAQSSSGSSDTADSDGSTASGGSGSDGGLLPDLSGGSDSDGTRDGASTPKLGGEDGVVTGDKGLLPADKTGATGDLVDGLVGGVDDIVGGLVDGLSGG